MRNNNLLLRRCQLINGVSRYLLSQKRCAMDFYEGQFSKERLNIGSFQKAAFIMAYMGMLILKLKKEATTTLKNSEYHY